MPRYPVDRLAFSAMIALACGIWASKQGAWPVAAVCAAAGLCALLLYLLRNQKLWRRFAVLGLFFCLGSLLFALANTQHADFKEIVSANQNAELQVRIQQATDGARWLHADVLAVNGQSLVQPVRTRLYLAYQDPGVYERAAIYQFQGTLRPLEAARNPGGYNEEQHLFSKGIQVVCKANKTGVKLQSASGIQAAINARQIDLHRLMARSLSPAHLALTEAVLFGEIGDLDKDFYSLSQRLGIIHIFSVSGLHVTIIVGFLLAIAQRFRMDKSLGLQLILIPLLYVYLVMCDMSPPAIRAAVMSVLGLLAWRLLRYRDTLTILALAAGGLLIANPFTLWDIGYQLTVLITAGIIVGYEPVRQALVFVPWDHVRSALALSVAAELVSAPLVAWYFYIFAPMSIVMNLIVVPLFSLMVPLVLVAIAFAWIATPLGTPFFALVSAVLYMVTAIMEVFSSVFGSGHRYIGQPDLISLAVYIIVVAVLFYASARSSATRRRILALLLAFIMMVTLLPQRADRALSLTVLDVGQGSSATYQSPEGRWLVFDAGPSADTTAQYLRYCGVNTVEAVVLSHADLDHIGGLQHLVRDFKVRHLLLTPAALEKEEIRTLLPFLQERQVKVVPIDAAGRLTIDAMTTLHLEVFDRGEAKDANANQLVAYLENNNERLLLPGDTSAEGLRMLDKVGPVDVVTVPHHGSRSSWSDVFYKRIAPRMAVISSGRENRFGHPHGDVLQGLTEAHIPYVQTDEVGAVRFYRGVDAMHYQETVQNGR